MNLNGAKLIVKNMPPASNALISCSPGCGVISMLEDYAKEDGLEYYYIRLSQMTVADIVGLEYKDVDLSTGKITPIRATPDYWPRDPNSRGILVFDEVNRATVDVINAIFLATAYRRVNDLDIPTGWKIILRTSEDLSTMRIDPYILLDRFYFVAMIDRF